jgi:hypothetical protein
MEPITGVFRSAKTATETAAALHRVGFPHSRINLLLPGTPEKQIHDVPTSEMEQPGAVGAAFGGVLGGALGMVAGYGLGVGVTALIPGVGPVIAVGIAAAALLGAGGAVGGAIAGAAKDHRNTQGLPADELFFYEDALRQGKSVVIVFAADAQEEERARYVMSNGRAESLDAAREAWWIGLRDAEREHYQALGENFEADQEAYRTGFEAALHPDLRWKSAVQAMDLLAERYPDLWENQAFRHGFERGQAYWSKRNPEAATSGSTAVPSSTISS